MQKAFRHRWLTSDVPDSNGDGIILIDDDFKADSANQAVLDVLSEYRCLDAPYIAALIGSNERHIYRVVKVLKSRSNHYIQLVSLQRERTRAFSINATLFYELSPKGITHQRARGVPVAARSDFRLLEHKTMEEQIMAAPEIAARKYPEIELVKRAGIIADPRSQGLTLPEVVNFDKDRYLRFDGRALVLRKPRVFTYFWPGIEAETGSHSIEAVADKFRDNIELFERGFHITQYNARDSLRIPYFTPVQDHLAPPDTEHLDNMIKRWRLETRKYPQWRPRLWFKPHPTYLSPNRPRPTAHMFEEPFMYVDTTGEVKHLNLLQ